MQNKPIIIRKYKKYRHRSNSGAWKIAYADFVTAMMALFLLMWLINVTTDETKKGISEYFTASIIKMESENAGTKAIEGEGSVTQNGDTDQETMTDNDQRYNSDSATKNDQDISKNKASTKHSENVDEVVKEDHEVKKIALEKRQRKEELQKVEKTVKNAFNSLQERENFKHNLVIGLTNEGIRIQILDSHDQAMFKSGCSIPMKVTEKIIRALGGILTKLPNKIDITGHTDSKPYCKKAYGNWELSSDRANSTRRILEDSGVKSEQFSEVHGRADRDPLNKSNSNAPENRRVSITILHIDSQEQKNTAVTLNQKNSNSKIPKIIL